MLRLARWSVLVPVAVAALLAPTGALASPATDVAYRAGVKTYVHGYAPLLSQASQSTFPVNTMVSTAGPSGPANRVAVLPNVDAAFAVAKLDLTAGPQTVHLPAEPGRYHVMQLIDAYTGVAGYIGTPTTGDGPVTAMVVGPGWRGEVPAGVQLLRSPTADALLLGRTLLLPGDTLPALKQLVGQYTLNGAAPIVLDEPPPRTSPSVPRGRGFVEAFDALLERNPPAAAERAALRPLRRFGVGAAQAGRLEDLPAAARAAFLRGLAAGPARVDREVRKRRRAAVRRHAGWEVLDPRTGDFGTDYLLRAVVAKVALWANTPRESIYVLASTDEAGRPLDGRHRYELRVPRPVPARSWWSVTMYDGGLHTFANPLDRYSLGSLSPDLASRGGSYRVRLSHGAPATDRTSWLPAPRGRFTVALRLYTPTAAARRSGWAPPGIRCLDCRR